MTKKVIVAVSCLILFGVLLAITWPLPLMIFGDIGGGLVGFFTHTEFWTSVGVVLGVLLVAALAIVFAWPLIAFLVKRIYVYVSLVCLCAGRKYKFRMIRAPFASLKKMAANGDIMISSSDGTLHLHFLDVVYPRKRMLTFPNESEYVITPTAQGNIVIEGGRHPVPVAGSQHQAGHGRFIKRASGYSVQKNKDRTKKLPTVLNRLGERHIIIVQTMPVDVKKIQANKGTVPVSNDTAIGSFTFYTVSYLKKGLKNQLHSSLFGDEKRGHSLY